MQTANAIAFDPDGGRSRWPAAATPTSGRSSWPTPIRVSPRGRCSRRRGGPDGGVLARRGMARHDRGGRAARALATVRLRDRRATASRPPRSRSPPANGRVRAEFSPDGRTIVTAANDGVARLFDAQTHRQTGVLTTPGLMLGATFSPDGRRILTYGSDFIGRIWDARTGRRLAALRGHSSWISSGAFSPDGRQVVTGSVDQTTRVWDSLSGRLLSTQREHGEPSTASPQPRRTADPVGRRRRDRPRLPLRDLPPRSRTSSGWPASGSSARGADQLYLAGEAVRPPASTSRRASTRSSPATSLRPALLRRTRPSRRAACR